MAVHPLVVLYVAPAASLRPVPGGGRFRCTGTRPGVILSGPGAPLGPVTSHSQHGPEPMVEGGTPLRKGLATLAFRGAVAVVAVL